ncbi:MerR family transcriptional regulator [Rothia nasimurium]|uniref:MerR family transcriptional regulator n=1 Tax=Rothia nasimurium TaxID=85336 RepID=UPI001F206DCA|nr:MerR family transcriptional regulator [Rothia nasimurium]
MKDQETLYTVGEVAQALGVTVRTLHHWESLGLVAPAERTWSNYRLYTPDDIATLQRILIYRATGMKLNDIKEALASSSNSLEHLRKQRQALMEQQQQLSAMVTAIDTLMENEMTNKKLTLTEIGEVLGDANFANYQAEAEERYTGTDDWAISQQRTASWSRADWAASKERFADIDSKLADAVRRNLPADGTEAGELVHAHRQLLSEFFPVTPAKHYLISRGYVTDERFTSYYESQQPGLAQWLANAIEAEAERAGVDLANPSWD